MTISGTDLTLGSSIKWYHGGVATNTSYTVTADDVSAGYVAIPGTGATAEYGSVIITVDGTVTACLEFAADGDTPATDATGTKTITYASMTADDVVEFWFLDVSSTTLTQIATSTKVSQSTTPDKKTATVHGQANKITYMGASVTAVTVEEFVYSTAFIAACVGDSISASPAAGKTKITNAVNGFKTIGGLVGKIRNSAGTVTKKYILADAQATGFSGEFPSDDAFTDKMTFDASYFVEVDLS